jgi:hypothetical protein
MQTTHSNQTPSWSQVRAATPRRSRSSQNADGTEWECYIGQAAVTQKIIGAGFLGQYSPTPGVG